MRGELQVATRKGLFTFAKNGKGTKKAWNINRVDFLADHVSNVLQDPRDGAIYAALDHGHFGVKLHRADRGGDFKEIAVPAYPEVPEGFVDKDGFGRPLKWDLVKVWGLTAGGADRPGEIWCGTIPGAIFKSANRGDTWEIVRSLWDHPGRKKWIGGGMDLPGSHEILVDPNDSKTVRIAVSCGGIWETKDSGENWSNIGKGLRADHFPPDLERDPGIQDVHGLAQCAGAPERMWVQHHNGVFVSSDTGKTFTEIHGIDPSNFGFPVVAHPKDKDKAWFVPGIKDEKRIPADGKLVVTRTSDGGKSFEKLSKGLPQKHAYDIVLRHAFHIDETGDRLAFGSTTGGLWISEDQGESWTGVEARLPPVYCVRFATA